MKNPLHTTAQIRIITGLDTAEEKRWVFEVRPWVWVFAVVGGLVVGYALSVFRGYP